MSLDPLSLLACPRCRGSLGTRGAEVRCERCGARYPRTDGVYRLIEPESRDSWAARSFGAVWRRRYDERAEGEALYGFSPAEHVERFLRGLGLGLDALRDLVVLDAGCGTGLLARELAPRVAHVVAVDLTDEMGGDVPRPLPDNLTLVQGDVLRLPVRPGRFDVVWSAGVIHTTADPRGAFAELVRCARPDGRLYVWVDSKSPNPVQNLHEVLPRLSPRAHVALSRILALPVALAVRLSRSGRYRPLSVGQAAFRIHDHLASPHPFRFELSELAQWCAEHGCAPPTDVSEERSGLAIRTRAPAAG